VYFFGVFTNILAMICVIGEIVSVPQLTIYLDPKAERLIEHAAKREALSLSRWAREKLVLAAGAPSWPDGYEAVLGSISDRSFNAPSDPVGIGDQIPDFGS